MNKRAEKPTIIGNVVIKIAIFADELAKSHEKNNPSDDSGLGAADCSVGSDLVRHVAQRIAQPGRPAVSVVATSAVSAVASRLVAQDGETYGGSAP